MSQALPDTITNSEDYVAHFQSQFRALLRFGHQHPTLAASFLYLCASVVGLFHTINLLNAFHVDALTHLELLDFILGAIHEPKAFIYVACGLAFIYLLLRLEIALRSRFPRYARASDKYNKPFFRISPLLVLALVGIIYTNVSSDLSALSRASAIKRGETPHYRITAIYPMAAAEQQLTLPKVQLVTATSRYLWLYDGQQVLMLPHDNVASLVPLDSLETNSGPEGATEDKGNNATGEMPPAEVTKPAEEKSQNTAAPETGQP
ncbi:hypothetical protein [Gallaecimonas sp. GXIMD4217]|uniref:hypothetical protein n=1 Tax=Gallaecimonas sp. GXIMD4217 TaxID=3131927 RepID=UPI00311B03F8